jgi:Holliday junction resolvasome RuvABC endonuclease subunit
MNILAIDPSNSTGFAVCKVDKGVADIFEYGVISCSTLNNEGKKLLFLKAEVQKLIKKYDVKFLAVEDYMFPSSSRRAKRASNNANLNPALRGSVWMAAAELGIEYAVIPISPWKKYVSGSTRPSKEQVKKWGKEKAKKWYIQKALWERYGIRFPNHMQSPNSNRVIQFPSDPVDAVAQLIYFVNGIKEMDAKFTYSFDLPKDHVFKKYTGFTY